MEWKEVRLGDIVSIKSGLAYKGAFIGKGENILLGMGCVSFKDKFLFSGARPYEADCDDKYCVEPGDIVLATRQQSDNLPILAMPAIIPSSLKAKKIIYGTNLYKVENHSEVTNDFLFWQLKTPDYIDYISSVKTGSVVRMVTKKNVEDYVFRCPPKEVRDRISKLLWGLDRKIELNNKINADLEEMAQAIFKNWFVDFEPFKDGKFVDSELGMIPEGWKVGRLTEIASYMNGLAMQKFPPENNEDSLPVLKIKELGQGFCGTDSDRCSCNIKDECKIHNGDVIFSWSGTLLVDVWCGGDCGLNQHLFKVTSKDYPKWFYYYWTKHHLQEFIHIAKDKAVTMGHIKRGHLEEALVAIPDNDSMEKAHKLFEPILSKMISLRLENSRLSLLRDTLLPRLMSGELEVPE
ncbi:restriction endonuclease subunit S [Segatella copri]|uniref:Restriction endonuclease subunit S n=1 Tax=Segatella copri TaxID=165179 RepID=A0AA91TM23_9BACT|nr:restriction endonuclease subunit S [Segatella copri]OXL45401.1 restriction endonuclease subunit S [Segatella copri]